MLRAPDRIEARLRTETHTELAALERLRPEWTRLWAEDTRATPFQSPAWLLPWWKHVGVGTLATIALRCDGSGELVGLVPLYVHVDAATGQRQLFPVGIATTDYLDLLARPGREAEIVGALWRHLADAHGWDVLEFPQLRVGASLLEGAGPGPWRCETRRDAPHPVLPLAGAGPHGRLPVPKSAAANLRTCRNRAARAGAGRFEHADEGSLAEFLEALSALHARRWAQRGLPGVLADAAVRACHAEAAPLLHAAGLLRLSGLRVDGVLVAVLYCLADPPDRPERRWYDYIGGFDPRFAAIGPGTLLVGHAIEAAIAEGAAAFDFLRGAEPYKYHWGAIDQPMFALRLARARHAGRRSVDPG